MTDNTEVCRCAPKCPGAKWDFLFPLISYCIQIGNLLCFHSVYTGSCYLLGRRSIKAGRKEDLSVLLVRKLQDLGEKTRGQVQTKGLPSIRAEQLKRLGSSPRVMRSAGKRAPIVLLPNSSFIDSLRFSREVG